MNTFIRYVVEMDYLSNTPHGHCYDDNYTFINKIDAYKKYRSLVKKYINNNEGTYGFAIFMIDEVRNNSKYLIRRL